MLTSRLLRTTIPVVSVTMRGNTTNGPAGKLLGKGNDSLAAHDEKFFSPALLGVIFVLVLFGTIPTILEDSGSILHSP